LLIDVDVSRGGIALLRILDPVARRDYLTAPSPLFKFAANNQQAFLSTECVGATASQSGPGQCDLAARSPHNDVSFEVHASFSPDPSVAWFEMEAFNLTADNMFLRVVLPCVTGIKTPGREGDMMGALPQEGGWVAPLSSAHPWGLPPRSLGMPLVVDIGLPIPRNHMELASIYDAATGGGVFFCDVDGDLDNGIAPLQFMLDSSNVLGFWIGNVPANGTLKLPRLAIGVHSDGDWRRAVDYYTKVHRPRWAFPTTPEWLRAAPAIYTPGGGGAGGIYLSLPPRNLGPWNGEIYCIGNFQDLPKLLGEAQSLGTNVLYLVDYWDLPLECQQQPPAPPYFNKGDYEPRSDLGGPTAFVDGIKEVHRLGGRVLLYVEAFCVYPCSKVGNQNGQAWGGRDLDGQLWGFDKPTKEKPDPPNQVDYPFTFEMVAPFQGWQDYMVSVAERLVGQYGADGIFLDSYAWQMNRPMYNKAENRAYSAQEYSVGVLNLVGRVRESIQRINPEAVVIGETTAGPIARHWDGGLNADLGFGNIWSPDGDPLSPENQHAPERLIASPVRYGIPEVRMFGNGHSLNGLHQMYAAGHGLALCNIQNGGFMADNAAHIHTMAQIRTQYRDALMDGLQIDQPKTGNLNVIAYHFQGRYTRVLTILNIGPNDQVANIDLRPYDPLGSWLNLLSDGNPSLAGVPSFQTVGGVLENIKLTTGQGSLLVLLNLPATLRQVFCGGKGIVYALMDNGDLLWYRHEGESDGSFRWTDNQGTKVGTGWDFKLVFPGGNGVIYAINYENDLLWYRHDGAADGTFRWAGNSGSKVGTGWNLSQVFSGGNGVIYAVADNGDLLWFRHDGQSDGSFRWTDNNPRKVGTGWNVRQVFSGGGGIIYAIAANADLLWFRHDGASDGSFKWADNNGRKVGTGWNSAQVFPSGNADGVIYSITFGGDLLWYRHDGRSDGSFKWASNTGSKVGAGWNFSRVIYAVAQNNDLLWYRHDGWGDGSFKWTNNSGAKVGTGWNLKQVLSGGNGVIYGLADNGDLLWFRHEGQGDGSFKWVDNNPRKVGTGWNFKQVFSASDGVIYALADNGDLLWYRHEGWGDGSFKWVDNNPRKVGTGWNFKQAFAVGDGVIYALAGNGDLLWYRHEGQGDGSFKWVDNNPRKVGTGWNFKQVFSAGDGVIYALAGNGDLLWYRHEGWGDGSFKWVDNNPTKVGTGWNFKQVFAA
jgi:Tachylectin/Domain of unknown function (DUF6259)